MKGTAWFAIFLSCVLQRRAQHHQSQGDMSDILRTQCMNGGEKALLSAQAATHNAAVCMRRAREGMLTKYNDTDARIQSFCREPPKLFKCLDDFMKEISVCYDDGERSAIYIATNSTKGGFEYLCSNEGERVKLFMEEGGPECTAETQIKLMECSMTALPKLLDGKSQNHEHKSLESQCLIIDELKRCIVDAALTCEGATPAEIYGGTINAMKKHGPCAKYYNPNGAGTSTNPLTHAMICVAVTFISLSLN